MASVRDTVSAVIADVREHGDLAVREYSEKFDNWSPDSFRLTAEEIDRIVATVPDQAVADIRTVHARMREFACRQRDSLRDFEVETEPGVLLGQKNIPIAAAGAYVPGGRYPLVCAPSSCWRASRHRLRRHGRRAHRRGTNRLSP